MIRVEKIDMSVFNAGMSGLIKDCRINERTVVEKETGEIIKTLVRLTPPASPEATRKGIANRIDRVFTGLSRQVASEKASDTVSKKYPGTVWYAANPQYLFGISQEKDMRRATTAQLRDVFLGTKFIGRKGGLKKARVTYPFVRSKSTKQKVALLQQIITTKVQINKLKSRMKKNVGRLKAGWIVATARGAIRMSSNFSIPQWVSRHAEGARGGYDNWLDQPDHPAFQISNYARGIRGKYAFGLAQRAFNIRGKAMLQNARMFLSGKKDLADYARWANTTTAAAAQ